MIIFVHLHVPQTTSSSSSVVMPLTTQANTVLRLTCLYQTRSRRRHSRLIYQHLSVPVLYLKASIMRGTSVE